jgi:hypothetical protein
MIAFSAIWLFLIAGVTAFPMLALRKRKNMTLWDYIYPFTGIVAWFLISGTGSTVSLSNLVVELFWIAVISAAVPWACWILSGFDGKPLKAWSLLLTFLPIIAAVVIRLTVPTLPE